MVKVAIRHAPEGLGHVLAQSAHLTHVLLAAEAVNDGASGKEEQRLEEGVRHQVEDARAIGRNAATHEHVAKLRNGGVRQHLLDVGLHYADGRGKDRRQRSDNCDHRSARSARG